MKHTENPREKQTPKQTQPTTRPAQRTTQPTTPQHPGQSAPGTSRNMPPRSPSK